MKLVGGGTMERSVSTGRCKNFDGFTRKKRSDARTPGLANAEMGKVCKPPCTSQEQKGGCEATGQQS